MADCTVSRLMRWPVKGMAGEEVQALSLGLHGAGGDRVHALQVRTDEGWRRASRRDVAALAAWSAAYPFNLGAGLDPEKPPVAMVTRPDGRRSWRWGDPQLRSALEQDLGCPIQFERDAAGLNDRPHTVLVTTEGVRERLNTDLELLRGNVHLDLDADPAAGTELEIAGGVRLRVLEPCLRGSRSPVAPGAEAGVRARVLSGGRVAVGEGVRLRTP